MAGRVTIRVELTDGSIYEKSGQWTGGNPMFEAQEMDIRTSRVSQKIQDAIGANYGDIRKRKPKEERKMGETIDVGPVTVGDVEQWERDDEETDPDHDRSWPPKTIETKED